MSSKLKINLKIIDVCRKYEIFRSYRDEWGSLRFIRGRDGYRRLDQGFQFLNTNSKLPLKKNSLIDLSKIPYSVM